MGKITPLGFIGAGKMGSSLITGVIRAGEFIGCSGGNSDNIL